MDWTPSLYQLPLLISALIALAVAGAIARRRERVGVRYLTLLMLSLGLWSTCNALELAASTLSAKLLWANVAYVGIVSLPVLWFLFALQYAVGGRGVARRDLVLLCIIPAITLVLVWADPYLHQMRRNVRLDVSAGVATIGRDVGPWFVIHTLYSYLLVLSGSVLLVRVLVHSPHMYRRQGIALLVASLLPLLGNIAYLLMPREVMPLDVTPMSFALSGAAVAYGLSRYGLLDVVPAARAAVVEGMRDGLLVMDAANRLVDMNEAAEAIVCRTRQDCLGTPVSRVLPATAELLRTRTQRQEDVELASGPQGVRRCYEVRVSALYDGRGRLTGRLAVLRDVTLQRRAEEEREALLREVERRAQQLAALATELSQAEERERRRLAQLLHDHLQQLLVGAKLHLVALHDRAERHDQAAALQEAIAMLEQSIAASRALTVELSPPVLYEGTLAQALAWLARWVQERHGLTVVTCLEPHAEPAGDDVRILLFQAVRELLFNVVKHAHVDRAFVGMRLVDHDRIELTVADEGVGLLVPPSDDTLVAASGFGLFSIRERLLLLGGHMEVISAPGQGTRVTLNAPASPVPAPERIVARAPAPTPLTPTPANTALRVLLVDDHRTVREGVAALLRQEDGISVVGEAANGPMALELAARLCPDVAVVDVTLPGMSGIEVTRRIHALCPGVRVVGLSAHAEAAIADAMRAAGAEAYLDKGAPAEALIAAVRGRPTPLTTSRTAQV